MQVQVLLPAPGRNALSSDIRVQIVDYHPDIRVKKVEYTPERIGEWYFVDYSPDFKIEYVDYHPDLKVKFVDIL